MAQTETSQQNRGLQRAVDILTEGLFCFRHRHTLHKYNCTLHVIPPATASAGEERKTQAELKSSVSVVEEVARREGLDPGLINTLAGVVATWSRGRED